MKRFVAGAFGAVLLFFGCSLTLDPDMWWHLKTGEYIASHGIPKVDVFSYTAHGHPWVAHEWLSEFFMWFVYSAGGLEGLMLTFGILWVLIFSIVYFSCPGYRGIAMLLTLLACATCDFFGKIRPLVFNLLFFALFFNILFRVRSGKLSWKWFYMLPFLTMIWANLHSGFLIGIVLMGLFLIGDLSERLAGDKAGPEVLSFQALKHLGIATLLCLVFSLVNPNGWHLLVYPFETLMSPAMRGFIAEWRPPNFHDPVFFPFFGMVILGVLTFMLSRRRSGISEVMLYLGVFSAAFFSLRHIPFFAMIAAPIISGHLSGMIPRDQWERFFLVRLVNQKVSTIRTILWGILLVAIMGVVAFRIELGFRMIPGFIQSNFPVRAVEYLKTAKLAERRGLHQYHWGGYLIWSGIPVFIDGRADVYGDAFLENYKGIIFNAETREDAFSRYNVDYVLMAQGHPLMNSLLQDKNWKLAYEDEVAFIFVRKSLKTPGKRLT